VYDAADWTEVATWPLLTAVSTKGLVSGRVATSFIQNGSISDKAKAKARDSYIARLTGKPDQPRYTIIEVAVDRQEPMVL